MSHVEHSTNVAYYETLADTYSLFFRDLDKNMDEEGAWLDTVLRPYGARRVLDASCGTGRQSIPLAELGYEVLGADPSASMLQQAVANAQRRGARVSFVQAGFTDLPHDVGTGFDAVIALGNGLCNLEEREEILAALRAMWQCCRPGGICVIGIKDFDRVRTQRQRFHGHGIVDRDGVRTILFEVWDFADPHLVSTAYVLQGRLDQQSGEHATWTTRSAQTREYMLGRAELEVLAAEAGFASVERLDHRCEAVYTLSPSSRR